MHNMKTAAMCMGGIETQWQLHSNWGMCAGERYTEYFHHIDRRLS